MDGHYDGQMLIIDNYNGMFPDFALWLSKPPSIQLIKSLTDWEPMRIYIGETL